MRKHISIFVTVATCSLLTLQLSSAGTIPVGTAIVVKTNTSIYTKDMVRKEFTTHLVQDIVVKGKVVAPVGTDFVGKVETSTKFGPSPLTVDLTGAKLGGKVIPLKTTGAFKPQSAARGKRRQVTTRDFVLPPGSTLQFHLAQPLTM
jgi:hypothetical protein